MSNASKYEAVTKNDVEISMLKLSIEHISETLLRFEKRFDKIDDRLDRLDMKIDAIDKALNLKIDTVEKSLTSKMNNHLGWIIGTLIALGVINNDLIPKTIGHLSKLFGG